MKFVPLLLIVGTVSIAGCMQAVVYENKIFTDDQVSVCVKADVWNEQRIEKDNNRDALMNFGVHLFQGCTNGRVKDQARGLALVKQADAQFLMGATAFLGAKYGVYALDKHTAGGPDWSEDERLANFYTNKAVDHWNRLGRVGFKPFELNNLRYALVQQGLIRRRIHDDNEEAAKAYCLAVTVDPTNQAQRTSSAGNLGYIRKSLSDCKKYE